VRGGAERAVRRAIAGKLSLPAIALPVRIELDLHQVAQAELTELIPTVERTGPRSIRITSPDVVAAYRAMKAVLLVASVAA
jgi:D-aminopeptidase